MDYHYWHVADCTNLWCKALLFLFSMSPILVVRHYQNVEPTVAENIAHTRLCVVKAQPLSHRCLRHKFFSQQIFGWKHLQLNTNKNTTHAPLMNNKWYPSSKPDLALSGWSYPVQRVFYAAAFCHDAALVRIRAIHDKNLTHSLCKPLCLLA